MSNSSKPKTVVMDTQNESREQQLERFREDLQRGIRQADRGEVSELDREEFLRVARDRLAQLGRKEET